MKFNQPGKPSLPATPGLQQGEKMKLIVMVVALVFIVAALGATMLKSQSARKAAESAQNEQFPDLDENGPIVESVSLPEIDAAAVEALVNDRDKAMRLLIEDDALDLVAGWARQLRPRSFEALGAPIVETREALDAIAADPGAHRAEALRFRAGMEELRPHYWDGGERQGWLLRTRLADGGLAYYFALELGQDGTTLSQFMRFDGLFLKNFAVDEEQGWIEAPLFVGPRPVESFRALPDEIDIAQELAGVRDDDIAEQTGLEGGDGMANWALMAQAERIDEATVDWDAAVTLDKVTLGKILQEGEAYRGAAVVIPISKLLDFRVKKAGENPARLESYTEGWIGNTTWKDVIQFKMPGEPPPDVREGGFATARGYFLKNLAYEPRDGGLHVSPYFVLTSIEAFVPREDKTLTILLAAFGAGIVLMGVLFLFLLARDKRRSEELHANLLRRRRARRARSADGGSAESGPTGAEANA
jgi:hypothetical protein